MSKRRSWSRSRNRSRCRKCQKWAALATLPESLVNLSILAMRQSGWKTLMREHVLERPVVEDERWHIEVADVIICHPFCPPPPTSLQLTQELIRNYCICKAYTYYLVLADLTSVVDPEWFFPDPATNFWSSGSGSNPYYFKHIWKLFMKNLKLNFKKEYTIWHYLIQTTVLQ